MFQKSIDKGQGAVRDSMEKYKKVLVNISLLIGSIFLFLFWPNGLPDW